MEGEEVYVRSISSLISSQSAHLRMLLHLLAVTDCAGVIFCPPAIFCEDCAGGWWEGESVSECGGNKFNASVVLSLTLLQESGCVQLPGHEEGGAASTPS